MLDTLTSRSISELLTRVSDPSISDEAKTKAIEGILFKGTSLFELVARRYSVYPGIDRVRDFDDVVQIVREQAWLILREMANGGDRPGTFEAQLSKSSHAAIRDWADSGETTMGARVAAANRRARSELAQRELDDQTSQSHDQQRLSVIFGIEVDQSDGLDAAGHLEMQSVINKTLQEIAKFESPTLTSVAHLLLGWFPNNQQPSVAEIARALRLPWSTTTRYCNEVSAMFRRNYQSN